MWNLQIRQLLLPKLGHDVSECEDVIAVDTQECRFAVADGATEAFAAREWAERLACHWVTSKSGLTAEEFREWVSAEGRELHDSWDGLNLSWYAEEKARLGSFAAFIGVELDLAAGSPSWRAIALGDACLLHSRRGRLLKSFPLSGLESFHNGPTLVASDPSLHESSMRKVAIDSGECDNGDVLLLVSDAMAHWLLRCFGENDFNLSEFLNTRRIEDLRQFFDDERLAERMRNDDLALLEIEIKKRTLS